MKKILGLLASLVLFATTTQAQVLPPSPLTPEMQQQRADEARKNYDAQKQQGNADQQAP